MMKNIKCLQCQTETLHPQFLVFEYFICPNCQSTYKNQNGELVFQTSSSKFNFESDLRIGSKVFLKGEDYYLVNVVRVKNKDEYSWFEYKLLSASEKELYLTEEEGNWVLEEPLEDFNEELRNEFQYKELTFRKFGEGKSKEIYQSGFFDYKLSSEYINYQEFVCPPYLISFEKEGKNKQIFLGEYISKRKIAKIFGESNLPIKKEIGAAQPFYYNLTEVFTIVTIAILIITGLHIYFYTNSKDLLVYHEIIDLENNNNQEIYTNDFKLEGPVSPLSIFVQSDLDNSWLATDFSLIDQTNGEMIHFSKDFEYYYGYSEGENWTEGGNAGELNICAVNQGMYKLMIHPSKDELDKNNKVLNIQVYWGKPSNWNLYVCIFVLIIFSAILLMIKNNFEQKKWDGNPYLNKK